MELKDEFKGGDEKLIKAIESVLVLDELHALDVGSLARYMLAAAAVRLEGHQRAGLVKTVVLSDSKVTVEAPKVSACKLGDTHSPSDEDIDRLIATLGMPVSDWKIQQTREWLKSITPESKLPADESLDGAEPIYEIRSVSGGFDVADALDDVDASLFSGCLFMDERARKALINLAYRWLRRCREIGLDSNDPDHVPF